MKKTTLRHVGQSMAEGSFNFVRQKITPNKQSFFYSDVIDSDRTE